MVNLEEHHQLQIFLELGLPTLFRDGLIVFPFFLDFWSSEDRCRRHVLRKSNWQLRHVSIETVHPSIVDKEEADERQTD
eukprot:Skav227033  [mRNA]  locus=scaffold635:85724:89985:+ [translate_table: standard]